MDLGLVGIYWYNRRLTMRGYRDFLLDVVLLLRGAHSEFSSLYWVGDGRQGPIEIAGDLRNLDDLVGRYSWSEKKDICGEWSDEGTPAWEAENLIGYRMVLNTGKSAGEGGVTVHVHAGYGGAVVPNVVTISFPSADSGFRFREFYAYEFLRGLFIGMIRLASPETGLVTSHGFSNLIDPVGPYRIGYLTYFKDDRFGILADRFLTERADIPGTLISLGEDYMFVSSDESIMLGRQLFDAVNQVGLFR